MSGVSTFQSLTLAFAAPEATDAKLQVFNIWVK